MNVLEEMLRQYDCSNTEAKLNAIREVMQQITLSALSDSGFFKKATFYGGTCLRIFHGLRRFSEDMDFSLLREDKDFDATTYLEGIKKTFAEYGQEVNVAPKKKTKQSAIQSAFLKSTTSQFNLTLERGRLVTIKIEIDTLPPLGFDTEQKLLLQPQAFFCSCMTLPCLFAGKMHALLFRNWKNRVKGRDWYDFAWYVKKGIPIHFEHLKKRIAQFHSIDNTDISVEDFHNLLRNKIDHLNIKSALEDVLPFMENPSEVSIWSRDYFLQLANMVKLTI